MKTVICKLWKDDHHSKLFINSINKPSWNLRRVHCSNTRHGHCKWILIHKSQLSIPLCLIMFGESHKIIINISDESFCVCDAMGKLEIGRSFLKCQVDWFHWYWINIEVYYKFRNLLMMSNWKRSKCINSYLPLKFPLSCEMIRRIYFRQ